MHAGGASLAAEGALDILSSLLSVVHLPELPDADMAAIVGSRVPQLQALQAPGLATLRLCQLLSSTCSSSARHAAGSSWSGRVVRWHWSCLGGAALVGPAGVCCQRVSRAEHLGLGSVCDSGGFCAILCNSCWLNSLPGPWVTAGRTSCYLLDT